MLSLFSKQIILCIYCFSFHVILLSQKTSVFSPTFPFHHIEFYDSRNGFKGNQVYFVSQDKQGFLWFMADNGLNRFDGYTFRSWSYMANDANTPPMAQYWGIAEDKMGTLWIPGASTGLFSFDPIREKFNSYHPEQGNSNSLSSENLYAVVADHKGMIWIATDKGLDKYDPFLKQFVHFRHDDNDTTTIFSNKIYGLVADENNAEFLWIVGPTLGLDCFNTRTGKVIGHFPLPFAATLYSDYLRLAPYADPWISVFGMKNGNIWIGSNDQGIFGFNTRNHQFSFIKIERPCKSEVHVEGLYHVIEDESGNLWTMNDNNEIVFYNRAIEHFYFHPIEKSNIDFKNLASIIYQDKSGKIWICTTDGLIAVNTRPKKFFNSRQDTGDKKSTSGNFVYAIYRTREEELLVGTSVGVDRFNDKTKTFSRFPLLENGKEIDAREKRTIYQDSKGVLWFGGWKGIASFDPVTKKSRQYNLRNDSIDLSDIATGGVTEDKNGRYWAVSFNGGLYSFDPVTGYTQSLKAATLEDSTLTQEMASLFMSSKGLFYINVWNGGFLTFNPESVKFRIYKHNANDPNSVSHDNCHSFIEETNGLIWFGTFGGGINVFNPAIEKFKAFTTKDGLPHNTVYSIIKDKKGNFWAGTGTGETITTFCPPEDPFSPDCKIIFRNYDISEDMPASKFTSNSAFCDTDGTLYFGTQGGGLLYFHPDHLKDNPFKPAIHLTEFRVLNKPLYVNDSTGILETSIGYTKKIRLNYRQNSISFSFAALNYIHPEKNQYAYMLEAYDKEWILTDASRRFANYTNLPPGQYVFKVKGSNNDGIWNETPRELIIIITPPFWQTWWFKLLVVLAVIAIIYGIYRYRLQQVLRLQKIRNRIAADLHDDIGSTLNSISVFSEVAKNDPLKRDESLDMIGDSSRKVTEAMSDIVWTINPDNDSFEKMILRMRSLAYTLLRAKNIEFTFRADEELNNLKILMEKRKNFFLIFKEILNNLIKHSQATGVAFSITKIDKKFVVLGVQDNGTGFDPTKVYTGNGLNNIRTRAKEMGAKLIIESGNGNGTIIQLIIKP